MFTLADVAFDFAAPDEFASAFLFLFLDERLVTPSAAEEVTSIHTVARLVTFPS